MHFVYQHIQTFSLVMVLLGWYIHMLGLFAYLTRIKGKATGFKWYWTNRRNKFIQGLVSGLVFGLIAYIYFDPSSLDMSIKDQRHEFVYYLLALIGIGSGNSFVIDLVGSKASTRKPAEQYEDDGKTIIVNKGNK